MLMFVSIKLCIKIYKLFILVISVVVLRNKVELAINIYVSTCVAREDVDAIGACHFKS